MKHKIEILPEGIFLNEKPILTKKETTPLPISIKDTEIYNALSSEIKKSNSIIKDKDIFTFKEKTIAYVSKKHLIIST